MERSECVCSSSKTSRPCTLPKFATHCTCSQTARLKIMIIKKINRHDFERSGDRKSKSAVFFLQRHRHGDETIQSVKTKHKKHTFVLFVCRLKHQQSH